MIKTDNVVKYYDDISVIDRINLHVNKGSIYGLVGPNGAGKTTMIKMLSGIYKVSEGVITIDGEKVFDNQHIKKRIFYMAEELYFDRSVTIGDMRTFYKGLYETFDDDRFTYLMASLGFSIKQKISKLSKGMKKQVAFILGISIHPDVMILDEPIDGLDPVVRKSIWSMIVQEVATREMTVLISSHNLKELEGICDTFGIIYEGRLIVEKTLEEMKISLQKIQVAFCKEEDITAISPLFIEQVGSIITMIFRGTEEDVKALLAPYQKKMMDFVPLTFEEIFIYEIGGAGYELKNIIL